MIVNPYKLPTATAIIKGGVRASPRIAEALPVVIDAVTALMYVNAETPEQLDARFAALLDNTPEFLNTLKEFSTAIGNDPDFINTMTGLIGDTTDKIDSHELLQQLRTKFVMSTSTLYQEITYTNGDPTQINYWDGEAKTTLLFREDLTYTNGNLTRDVVTDETTGKTSTKTFTYPSEDKITVMEVIA